MWKTMMRILARAESGEGSGKWEVGRVDRKKGGWEGVDGNGRGGGGDREGESGRGQRGGGDVEGSNRDGKRVGNGEGDNVRRRWRGGQWGRGGRWEGGNGEGGKMKEVGMGRGRRRGKRRGDFTDGYDGMPGWT